MLDLTTKKRSLGLAMNREVALTPKPLLNGSPSSLTLDPEDRLLTVTQAAELSSVDPVFIRKAVRSRQLRMVILGPKTHRIRLVELQRWWKSNQQIGFIGRLC